MWQMIGMYANHFEQKKDVWVLAFGWLVCQFQSKCCSEQIMAHFMLGSMFSFLVAYLTVHNVCMRICRGCVNDILYFARYRSAIFIKCGWCIFDDCRSSGQIICGYPIKLYHYDYLVYSMALFSCICLINSMFLLMLHTLA